MFINMFGTNNDPNVWSNPKKWDLECMMNNESLDLNIQNLSIMPFGTCKKICASITHILNLMFSYVYQTCLKCKHLQ